MLKALRVNAVLTWIASAMLYSALGLLLLLAFLVVLQVVCRNVFDIGLPWADELSRFCGLGLVFLAIPHLLVRDRHISMDMFVHLLPSRGQTVLAVVRGMAALAFCAIILWALYAFLERAGKFATPALGIPNMLFYTPAILGFTFFAAISLVRLLSPSARPERDRTEEPEA